MPMYWLEVSIVTGEQAAEGVAAAIEPFAYQETVVLEQLGDPDDLDPNAMLPYVTVKFYVAEENDTPALRQAIIAKVAAIQSDFPAQFPTFRPLQDEDWANAWKVHYKPFKLGQRLWIQPSWEKAVDAAATDIVLTLDPGMAFGTGLHATTQLCLALLEELVEPGDRVLDVGTGSGILAIAAAKLGAASVTAIDNDPLSITATQGNVAMNHVESLVQVWQGELVSVPVEPYDVVVVNILAPVIIGLLRSGGLLHYVAPDGHLILSGLIAIQKEEVSEAVAAAGGSIISARQDGDWLALHVKPTL
ncbi:MAG: 50S ribosomal protein L11 methyltransferase [Acidobacteria bacterium]|nr:50S ribosomal protein L11 methyltransferase [Acidobacteriota bacterium]